MNSNLSRKLCGVIVIFSVLFTPVVAIFGPFQNGDNRTPTELFLPADYAFSIWGVIYLGLLELGVWLLLPRQGANPRANSAAPWLAVTALFNVLWILLAGSSRTLPWTVPTLIVMEVSAWLAYFRLGVHWNATLPRAERLLYVPLQIYVGWLSVATVANSATALSVLGWGGFGIDDVSWTLIMLFVATGLAYAVGRAAGQDNVYRAVFVWAFVAITVAQWSVPVVAWTAAVMSALVLLMIVRPPRKILRTADAS